MEGNDRYVFTPEERELYAGLVGAIGLAQARTEGALLAICKTRGLAGAWSPLPDGTGLVRVTVDADANKPAS